MCARAHACTYTRASVTNDPKLRDTLRKPLMVYLYIFTYVYIYTFIYIYVYIYIYMSVCVCALQAYTSVNFAILWYKKDNAIGLRRKTGDKKQFMSFRSKTCSEEGMRKIADDCLRKLDAGTAVDVVKEWAGRQLE
jgi:hypothetical protein